MFSKIFQALIDIIVGVATFFVLDVWTGLGVNAILVITLIVTALFAEFTETGLKK